MSLRACIRKHKGVNFDALMATAAAYPAGTEQERLQRATDEIITHFRNERTDILAQIYKQAKKPLPKETVNAPQAPEAVESQSAETPQETAAAPLPNPLAKYVPANLSENVPDDVVKVLNDIKGADETPTAVRQEAADYLDMIFDAEGTESYGDEVTDARAWLTDVVAKHQTKKGPVRTVVSAPAGAPTNKKAKQGSVPNIASQMGVTAEDANAPAIEEKVVVQPTLTAAAVTQILTPEQKKDVKDYYGGKQAAAIESLAADYARWKTDPLTFIGHPMRSVLEHIRKKASTQFSKTVPNTPEERTTVQAIKQALRSWFLNPEQAASRLVVVQKWEDLSQAIRDRVAEAQKSVLKVTDYSGDTAYVFSNPERVQALNLLAKRENHDQIRGFMDDSGRITHVFPSAGLTHGRVANQLGFAQIHTADGKNHEFGSDYWFKSDLGEIMYPVYISGNEHQLSWHSIMGTKTGVIPDSAFGGVQFSKSLTNIQAFVLDGKGYMIADNISSGNEMAVFMHEIGAHIGLDGQEAQIMERVNLWRTSPEGSTEKRVFDAMQARMEAAGEVSDSEKVAYAVEEAVKAGVTPREVKMGMKLSDVKSAQDLVSWFAQYFKAAVDAVFKTNTRGFNAQQLVDMAYGAARDAMQNQEVGADVTAMSKKGFGPVDVMSSAFKRWFGDSPVVDDAGEPLLVYTGTSKDKDFTKFNVPKRGVWFTSDRDSASGYAQDNESRGLKAIPGKWNYEEVNTASRVIPAYLSIQKMYTMTPEDMKVINVPGYKAAQGRFFDTLRSQDYDGADFGGGVYVVLGSPTQIKSSVSNTGEFSDTNPDIKFSIAASLPPQFRNIAGSRSLQILDQVREAGTIIANNFGSLSNMVRRMEKQFPAIKKWHDVIVDIAEARTIREQVADDILQRAGQLNNDTRNTVNAFIFDSTWNQKWAYDPGFERTYAVDKDWDAKFPSRRFSVEDRAKVKSAFEAGKEEVKLTDQPKTVDPEYKRRLDAIAKATPNAAKLIKDIFKSGHQNREDMRAIMRKLKLNDSILRVTQLEGPYAPLRRFGNYMAEVKSKRVLELEALLENAKKDYATTEDAKTDKAKEERKGLKAMREELDGLLRDGDHYSLTFHDTVGLAKRTERELMATKKYAASYSGERIDAPYNNQSMPQDVLQRVLGEIKTQQLTGGATEQIRGQLEQMVKDMYQRTTEDHMARQSMKPRKYRFGADPDMLRAFGAQARADAIFLSHMEHGSDLTEATSEMYQKARASDNERIVSATNTALAHQRAMATYEETPFQDTVKSTLSIWQLALNPAYHVQNATQTFMKSLPMIASEFAGKPGASWSADYAQAWKLVQDGYKDWKTFVEKGEIKFDKIKDKGLREMMQHAARRNLIDVGLVDDFQQFDQFQTGFDSIDAGIRYAGRAAHKVRQMSRHVERMNRVSAASAAYKMAMAKGENQADAEMFAIRVLEQTQGDNSRLDAPLIIKKMPKILTIYKRYQLMVAALYVKAFHDAFKGESQEIRAVGRRMLGLQLMHAFAMGGVMGLPLINLAKIVLPMIFAGDDEPDDEDWLDRQLGDAGVPKWIMKGALHELLGLDTGAKLGDQNVFSILPYTELKMTKQGAADVAVGLLGPVGTEAMRWADGVARIKEGDFEAGVVKMLPRGASNAITSWQMAHEGIKVRNGDVLVRPEDISTIQTMLAGLGLPSAQINDFRWVQSQQIKINKFYIEAERQLRKDYIDASKDGGDTTGIISQWENLQAAKVTMRPYFNDEPTALKSKPLRLLFESTKKQAEREAESQAQFATE
jgi:hypothetical protein